MVRNIVVCLRLEEGGVMHTGRKMCEAYFTSLFGINMIHYCGMQSM